MTITATRPDVSVSTGMFIVIFWTICPPTLTFLRPGTGILSAFLGKSLSEVSEAAFETQRAWTGGNHSRYELVEHFFERLVPLDLDNDRVMMQDSISRIKVLVTSASKGLEVYEASSRQELKDSILKTTKVPYLTASGFTEPDEDDIYLDGGFGRVLHPKCETDLYLPLIWETVAHVFNPALSLEQVHHLYQTGHGYQGYSLNSKRHVVDYY